MKTLTQYMNEWKLSYDNINDIKTTCFIICNHVEPKEEGVALVISVPRDISLNRITIYTTTYYKNDDGKVQAYNQTWIKNDDEYYYLKNDNIYWQWVMLFNEDAISFLKTLLNANRQKINVCNICKFLLKKRKCYEFPCKNDDGKYYSKKEIKELMDEIK